MEDDGGLDDDEDQDGADDVDDDDGRLRPMAVPWKWASSQPQLVLWYSGAVV